MPATMGSLAVTSTGLVLLITGISDQMESVLLIGSNWIGCSGATGIRTLVSSKTSDSWPRPLRSVD